MKGDFSRRTFQANKHYSSVRMQQGRVQLDADWNEQVEIQQDLARKQAIDIIGQTGVPSDVSDSFKMTRQTDGLASFTVAPGRIYVDGILVELDQQIVLQMSDFPADFVAQLNADLTGGQKVGNRINVLVYLEVWERLITTLQDPNIAEVALGGPDTAARTQIIGQIKMQSFVNDSPSRPLEDAARLVNPNGRFVDLDPLKVTVDHDNPPAGNQLYRIEIHNPSTDAVGTGATFKWSRDNGSVIAEWTQGTSIIEVNTSGRVQFVQDQIVELLDEAHELQGNPGELIRIKSVKNTGPGKQELTLEKTPTGTYTTGKLVRLWHSTALAIGSGATLPDGGLSVNFPAARYRTGDAWNVVVRQGNTPTTALPAEPKHHFARLAVLNDFGQATIGVKDLRTVFAPLAGAAVATTKSSSTRARSYSQRSYFDDRTNFMFPICFNLTFEDAEHVPNSIKMTIFVGRVVSPGSANLIQISGDALNLVTQIAVNGQVMGVDKLRSAVELVRDHGGLTIDITQLIPRVVGIQQLVIAFIPTGDPTTFAVCDIHCE